MKLHEYYKTLNNDTETGWNVLELYFCCVMKSKTNGILSSFSDYCETLYKHANNKSEYRWCQVQKYSIKWHCPFYRQHKAFSQQENFSLDHFSKTKTVGLPSLPSRDYSTILIYLTIRYIFLVIRLNFPLLNFIPEKCIPWLQYETLAGSKLTMCLFAST